jgi:hypothetical protein
MFTQGRIRETEAIKHVKVGSRTGCLLNVQDGDFKRAVSELSVDQTEDSHPDLSAEQRLANNALKFRLDYVQLRAFEVKTVSNLLRIHR